MRQPLSATDGREAPVAALEREILLDRVSRLNRLNRLKLLRRLVRAGRYHVPAESVAEGLLRHLGFVERSLTTQQR